MKAKDLIEILKRNPEDDIYIHSSWGDCYTPLLKRGKTSKNEGVSILYSDISEHISDDYVLNLKVVH